MITCASCGPGLLRPSCPNCGESIKQQSADEILEQLLEQPAGTKQMLFARNLSCVGKRGSN